MELTTQEKRWVALKWKQIREGQRKADEANNEWNEINDAIKIKHLKEDHRRMLRGDFPMTDLMKSQAKSASLPLKDALDTGKWHSANAQRHIDDLQLFITMKKEGLL